MKKMCTFLTLFLIIFSLTLTQAATDCSSDSDCQADETCVNEECSTQVPTTEEEANTKIDDAYDCLEEKADDCSALTTQELALTIMATPDNIFDDCVDELEDRESSDNWGNVLDTALAIIALNHAGKDTEPSEEWLLEQNQTPTDLIWYLQQDSNGEVQCHIGYNAEDYTVNIDDNKKINKNAGSCLTRAQSNFWLQIANNCYDETFGIECDQDFIANLIYRNKNSPTIYVLEGTSSAPAFGSVDLKVKSRCFGDSSCDYEATAWATLALLETGHNVEEFIPYIIAMSETNEKYLPTAFVYTLTNYDDYASSLISEQKLGNYWEAKSTANDRYYDTSLALLALSSSTAEQIAKAKEWLLFSQGSNGCWQNSVKDTAMALWALEGRAGRSSSDGSSSVTYCSEASFFCIPSAECSSSEDVGDNYFCSSLSDTCCMTQNLKTCSEYNGQTCSSDQVCTGNSKKATDTDNCCTGSCEARAQENECEASFYTCMDSCSDFQEPVSAYACDQGQSCCRTKTTTPSSGSTWWIWVLIILILAVLVAIGYVYREQLKLYWFQLKTKFKKDDGKDSAASSTPVSGIPPRPGFPPVRRPRPMTAPQPRPVGQRRAPPQGRPQQPRPGQPKPQRRSYDRRDKAMSDTFKQLRDMSK